MTGASDEIPLADDALPKDGISLTDAYEHVLSFVCDHPARLPKFDSDWFEALQRSRAEERKIQVR